MLQCVSHQPWLICSVVQVAPELVNFSAQDLSLVAWSFATLGITHSQEWYEVLWYRMFLKATAAKLSTASAQALSNFGWALARCGRRLAGSRGFESIIQCIPVKLVCFCGCMCMFVMQLQKTHVSLQVGTSFFDSCTSVVCAPSAGGTTSKAYPEHAMPLLPHLICSKRIPTICIPRLLRHPATNQQAAVLLCCRLGVEPSHGWLDTYTDYVTRLMRDFTGQGVANLTWAYAQLGYIPAPEVVDQIFAHSQAISGRLGARECSRILWAIAALHQLYEQAEEPQETGAASTAAPSSRAGDGDTSAPSEVSSNPLSTPLELLQALLGQVDRCRRDCSSQDFANVLWSLAVLQLPLPAGFLPAFIDAMPPAARFFSSQEVSCSLWALAKLGQPPPAPLQASLLQSLARQMPEASCQSLSNALYGVAMLRIRPPRAFVQQLVSESLPLLPECQGQELATVVWALATLR